MSSPRYFWNDLLYLLHERKDNENKQIKIGKIRVEGLKRTRESTVTKEFKNLEKVKTFKELNDAITNGIKSISELGIFKNFDVILDSKEENTVDIILKCEESGISRYSVGTTISNRGEQELIGSIIRNNFFGIADKWIASLKVTNFKHPSGHFGLFLPHILPFKGDISLGAHTFAITEQKTFKQTSHGANVIFQFAKKHFISYDYNYRKSDPINEENQQTTGVLTQLHQSGVVSSISHTYLNRSENGSFIKLINTYAGLGGDVKYISSHFTLGAYIPIFTNILKFGLRLSGGIRYPLNPEKKLYLNDRLIERMRGFKYVGDIIPGTEQCVGGNVSFNAMGEILFPIHFRIAPLEMADAHAHVFVNAANVETHFLGEGNTREFKNAKDFVIEFAKAMNVSVGIGIVLLRRYGFRIELNYSYPLFENSTYNYSKKENRQVFGVIFESEGYF